MQVTHTFEPVFDQNAEYLILGSFPSVKSREQGFYYGHPQNRFWRVLAGVFMEDEQIKIPQSIEEKRYFLLEHHIALWDVIQSCDIKESSDSSIKGVIPNDIDRILQRTSVKAIFANGEKAYQLFLRYCKKEGQPPIIRLPSTSPANAAFPLQRLQMIWADAFSQYQ